MDIVPTAAHTTQSEDAGDFFGMVGQSAEMRALFESIRLVAPSDLPVLILGDTGTGKEEVARAVHALSPRRQHPLVVVNCSALAPGVVERELFGHTKGAYTGATEARIGLFGAAHGGTLFLDEVGELPREVQAKLLRAVQFGEVLRIGATEVERFDVRIVAATHVDLDQAVAEQRFRADLLARLNGERLGIPPLARRVSDLPRLAAHLLARHAKGGPPVMLTEDALALLATHAFPGNIRELEMTLRRSLLRCVERGVIAAADLRFAPLATTTPPVVETARPASVTTEGRTLDAIVREVVLQSIERHHGNKTAAAEELAIARTTLRRWDRSIDA